MLIANRELVVKFQKKHPLSRKPLDMWIFRTEKADWKTLVEVKETFPATDYVDGEYIFNVHGNDYRLYAEIIFTAKTVLITDVLTHAEYDKKRN